MKISIDVKIVQQTVTFNEQINREQKSHKVLKHVPLSQKYILLLFNPLKQHENMFYYRTRISFKHHKQQNHVKKLFKRHKNIKKKKHNNERSKNVSDDR